MNESLASEKIQPLSESGFFEFLEFAVGRNGSGRGSRRAYGINIGKVREVVRLPVINPLSSGPKGIAGVFELRGSPIHAVDLALALGDESSEISDSQQVIVVESGHKRAGLIVESAICLRRVSWSKILPPSSGAGTCFTGMAFEENGDSLYILDLERLLLKLEEVPGGPFAAVTSILRPELTFGQPKRAKASSILLVDDSPMIRSGVKAALQRIGYQVTEARDGTEAMFILEESLVGGYGKIDLVVSDVEMPEMDGIAFTKKVREHSALAKLPIILHAALPGKAGEQAGLDSGANAYVVKNDLRNLFDQLREILGSD